MDLMKTEYEFLDLSDVKEAELSSLKCALFQSTNESPAVSALGHSYTTIEKSSSEVVWVGSDKVSTCESVASVSVDGGECEMAPASPRAAGAGGAGGAAGAGGAPPPYAPPPYAQPQWPVAPPNVYVSQVTANVNVHGYMGQYYQPQPQFPGGERVRPHRRERRAKRAPSPPHHAPPYYLQYPQYFHPAAQAQGAPLYHLPMYQPVVYGSYAYPPYYPEYSMPVEGEVGEKGPDEYAQEVVMEQEAVEAYYGGAYPPYPLEGAPLDYLPPVYLPPPHQPHPAHPHQPHPAHPHAAPPPHPPHPTHPTHPTHPAHPTHPTHPAHAAPHAPHHVPHSQHHQPQPHQFNVYAKNFVQGQGQNKTYTPQDKPLEQKSPHTTATVSATGGSVESLPMKDLKINSKGPTSPKHNERAPDTHNQAKPLSTPNEKVSPSPKDAAKPAWGSTENKAPESPINTQAPPASKTFPPIASANNQAGIKIPPVVGKPSKGPAAPFSGNKQQPKPPVPQVSVPVQQNVSTPKAPFGNRQKREGTINRSPSSENAENSNVATVEHQKREPPLPPSKAPMPISITLPTQGPPMIVTNKSPFGHSRKAAVEPAPLPPPPPPPAPTASDFPPPPTPRNRPEPAPQPVLPQQPAPGKSWASLFSNKATITSAPAPAPAEEPSSPTITTPPVAPNVQKPVAKVPPFDASPSASVDKSSPTPRQTTTAPAVSYSEKTSVNAVSNVTAPAPPKPATLPTEVIVPIQKEPTPALPVQPSPFSDDPNSYRMGEFLSKYQLDNRPVTLMPRGLTNRSNYCYVNAILQALIACPPFYNMLKALPYQTRRGKSSTPVIDSMVELCYEFSPMMGAGRVGRGPGGAGGPGGGARAEPGPPPPAGPPLDGGAGLRVLRALRPFPGSQDARQEDAEEFLGCLLNSLNDEMLELMKLVEPEEPKDSNGQQNGVIAPEQAPEEDDDDDEWKVMGPRNRGAVERRWAARRTPVADIFRGRTRVRLHRASHHDVTDAVQPFFTLQLDIERANSVKDALELLAGKDTLEGVSDAWQQLSLEQLPVVLLLHLKCFQLDAEGHTAKIVKNIDFPIDLKVDPKIMSSKMKYSSKQRQYKLFAVVYHEGVEAVKGHYVTDTYHGQVGWIRYDDSTVTQVTDAQVLKPKTPRMPYLLMYRRHDTLPQQHRAATKPE